MKNGKIKVGVVGTGFSADFHIQSLMRISDVEVVAVSGRSEDKASQLAAKYGIRKIYSDYARLIDDDEVEVIHNCTPNVLHYEINKMTLLAGKHLLSEKPLAMNSRESAELAELAGQSRGVSGVCFNYRHYPMVAQARSMVRKGDLGKVHLVFGGYLQDWLLYDTDYNWRLEPETGGASRAVADIGSHWCDTVQFVLNRPITAVFADLRTLHPVRKRPLGSVATFAGGMQEDTREIPVETEDFGSILVQFEGGVQGAFIVSQVSAGRKNRLFFEISGAQASLYWDQENPNRLWEGRRNEANRELMRDPGLLSPDAAELAHFPGGHEEGWPDGMRNLMIDFYREVRKKRVEMPDERVPSFATLQDGHRIMQLIEAILESNRKQQWVRVAR